MSVFALIARAPKRNQLHAGVRRAINPLGETHSGKCAAAAIEANVQRQSNTCQSRLLVHAALDC
jgi:hypothetical protein